VPVTIGMAAFTALCQTRWCDFESDPEGLKRKIVRPLDPWPHSEAGRFHRGIALLMVGLALLMVVVEGARHHDLAELALLAALLAAGALAARWLARDLRAHPANFPGPSPSQGLRMVVTGADGRPKGGRLQ
jgi:hypothetical protein